MGIVIDYDSVFTPDEWQDTDPEYVSGKFALEPRWVQAFHGDGDDCFSREGLGSVDANLISADERARFGFADDVFAVYVRESDDDSIDSGTLTADEYTQFCDDAEAYYIEPSEDDRYVTGPARWARYLINRDASGFDPVNYDDPVGERAAADRFEDEHGGFVEVAEETFADHFNGELQDCVYYRIDETDADA